MLLGPTKPQRWLSLRLFFQVSVHTGPITFAKKTLGASRVATTLYLGPLYAGLVGWLTLNESIGWHHAVGAAMILPGIYLASQAPPVAVVKNEN